MKTLPLLSLLLAFALPGFAQAPPEDAKALADAHEKEVHKLKLLYLQKLDTLAAKYRTSGKDDEANAIEKMIADAEGRKIDPKAKPTPEEFLQSLVGVWKRDIDGGIFNFTSTTGGTFGGNRKFTVTYDSEKQRAILVGDNWIDHLAPGSDKDTVVGSPVKGKRYKLTRVK